MGETGLMYSESEARELLKKALDKGVNFFDTADVYGDGRSEKFLGELIKSTSEKIFVTTKLLGKDCYPQNTPGEL